MTLRYRLENKNQPWRQEVVVVGCGGTGGFVAEGLCRLLVGHPEVPLVLIDHDRVEERNLLRQNFYREDLGRFKAEALAERLARKFGRPVAYRVGMLVPDEPAYNGLLNHAALVIGCVDNHPAREAIARRMGPDQWWIDAGNGRDFGQVLVGNVGAWQMGGAFDAGAGVCRRLPVPTLVCPELLVPAPPAPPCAQAVAAGEQSATINQAMAALVLEVARRILVSDCTWWQVYLDLGASTLRTVEATPEAVARLTGVGLGHLVKSGAQV